ncbi:MAG: PPC domain-containing protein [Planctomycetota bacterium]
MSPYLLSALLCLAGPPYSPEVSALDPAGGQRGTQVEIEVTGRRLFEPEGVSCLREGIEVVAVRSDKPEHCHLTLRLRPDCPLGAHPLRLRTAYGLSNLVLFHVGELPEVTRAEGDAPQAIPLDCTVNGTLPEGGCHRYAVALPAGVRVHCEVEALRLGFAPLDLRLAVADPDGLQIAACDDSALGQKDPLATFTAPAAGTYLVEVRSAFAHPGNRGVYRLHVGTFPRPTVTLPLAGAPGATSVVELRGDGAPSPTVVSLPDLPDSIFAHFPRSERGVAPTPVFLRVGGPPERALELDDQRRRFVRFPGSVSGVLDAPEQVERYFFHAEKGAELNFRVLARTLRSPLDPVLILRQADGRYLASNDDQSGLGMDCQLRFKASASGDYQLEVRDLLRRGSPEHVFRLEGEVPRDPSGLRLVVGRRDEAVVNVPSGGRMGGVLVSSGLVDLELLAQKLPPGVQASFGPLRKGLNQVPFLLSAGDDTARQDALVGFAVRDRDGKDERTVPFVQRVPLVTVRNNQPISYVAQRALPVAVTKPLPFAIEVLAPSVPVVRGAPLGLKVRVHRDGKSKVRLRLRALWSPPGVSAGDVVVEADRDEATLPLSASPSAMLGEFPFAVVATVYARGGRLEVASDFVTLSVQQPWLTGSLDDARTEPGAGVELRASCKLEQPATGKVRARLLGLPRGVTADAVELDSGATSLVFALRVAPDAATGRHRGVVVEAAVPSAGGDVLCRFGGGELRIDEPVAAPAEAGLERSRR